MSRPALTLKLASSLDGRIALANGQSRWITGEQAREAAHDLRATHDVVMIGSGTALADNPLLTVRGKPGPARQPVRLVLDTHLRQSLKAQLCCSTSEGRVIFACSAHADTAKTESFRACGVEVWRLPENGQGEVQLEALLDRAGAEGLGSVLIEGGGRLAASFMRTHPPLRIEWFRAPVLMGAEGRPAIGPLGIEALSDIPRYRRTGLRELGEDILESLERVGQD